MKILDRLNPVNYDNPNSIANKLRNKRFAFLEERIKKISPPVLKILDVGGEQEFWISRNYYNYPNIHITILNLFTEKIVHPNFSSVQGDATNMSNYQDGEFDLVFSNSVIEHLHSKEKQILMANEAQRVGKYHFIQTPNKYFIVEPHFLLPLFNFLPRKLQIFILTKTKLSRGTKRTKDSAVRFLSELRLLSGKEMKSLFPKSKIYKERALGLVKSITAHNLPD